MNADGKTVKVGRYQKEMTLDREGEISRKNHRDVSFALECRELFQDGKAGLEDRRMQD